MDNNLQKLNVLSIDPKHNYKKYQSKISEH